MKDLSLYINEREACNNLIIKELEEVKIQYLYICRTPVENSLYSTSNIDINVIGMLGEYYETALICEYLSIVRHPFKFITESNIFKLLFIRMGNCYLTKGKLPVDIIKTFIDSTPSSIIKTVKIFRENVNILEYKDYLLPFENQYHSGVGIFNPLGFYSLEALSYFVDVIKLMEYDKVKVKLNKFC